MRYARVHEIIKQDPALRKHLSKNTAAICRPDQTSEDFPVEIIAVTDEIHRQSLDAYTLSKLDVIRIAHRLLVLKVAPTPAAVEAPVVVPASVPSPKARRGRKKVEKPESPPPAEAAPPKRRRISPKVLATPARPEGVEPVPTGTKVESPCSSRLLPEFVRPDVPFIIGVAILSNFQAALTLLESCARAGDPEAKELCQKIVELIDDVHRKTVLPGAEKEHTESASTG